MRDAPQLADDTFVEVLNDDQTPFVFVVEAVTSAFGRSEAEAQQVANDALRVTIAENSPRASAAPAATRKKPSQSRLSMRRSGPRASGSAACRPHRASGSGACRRAVAIQFRAESARRRSTR